MNEQETLIQNTSQVNHVDCSTTNISTTSIDDTTTLLPSNQCHDFNKITESTTLEESTTINGIALCSVDKIISALNETLEQNVVRNPKNMSGCSGVVNVVDGITLSNDTIPLLNTLRSSRFGMEKYRKKRETIRHSDIGKVLNEEFAIYETELHKYALPGSSLVLSCENIDIYENTQPKKYQWSLANGRIITRQNAIKQYGGTITFKNVTPEDSGNYTCASYSFEGDKLGELQIELTVLDIPLYSINKQMVYKVDEKCTLYDVDLMSLYMPSVMRSLMCGMTSKACKVKIHDPHCLQKNDKSMISVLMSFAVNPLKNIFSNLNSSICDISCQKNIYGKLTSAILENVEMLEKIPIISRLDKKKVKYYPTHPDSSNDHSTSKPSQLVITCPAGFGFRRKERICVACEKNTYNPGDTSLCQACSPGMFTPSPGSKSCITCASIFQDPTCIKVLFYDTRTMKLYVGLSLSTLLIIILLILCYASTKRSKPITQMDKYQKYNKLESSRRKYEDEMFSPEEVPLLLLDGSWDRCARKPPPEPPPPDF